MLALSTLAADQWHAWQREQPLPDPLPRGLAPLDVIINGRSQLAGTTDLTSPFRRYVWVGQHTEHKAVDYRVHGIEWWQWRPDATHWSSEFRHVPYDVLHALLRRAEPDHTRIVRHDRNGPVRYQRESANRYTVILTGALPQGR